MLYFVLFSFEVLFLASVTICNTWPGLAVSTVVQVLRRWKRLSQNVMNDVGTFYDMNLLTRLTYYIVII